jgi:O-acetyl-ADP-ribose deacetylase (regulator of RNase III)
MREANLDLLDAYKQFDAICVTTNGQIRDDGQAVMGKGIALAVRERWPAVAKRLGGELSRRGNVVSLLGAVGGDGNYYTDLRNFDETLIFSFPTKKKWKDKSDLKLIEQSTKQLVLMAHQYELSAVALPRPGCQNGGLTWEQVKPAVSRFLDDRFTVVWL